MPCGAVVTGILPLIGEPCTGGHHLVGGGRPHRGGLGFGLGGDHRSGHGGSHRELRGIRGHLAPGVGHHAAVLDAVEGFLGRDGVAGGGGPGLVLPNK